MSPGWQAYVCPKACRSSMRQDVRLLQTETPRLRVERQAHVHAFGNTHYWLDPRNAQPITASIRGALARCPARRPLSKPIADAFLARLTTKDRTGKRARALPRHEGRGDARQLGVLCRALRAAIVAAAEPHPGISALASGASDALQRMRESNVQILIADPHANPALVQQIARKSGAQAVTLLPSATTTSPCSRRTSAAGGIPGPGCPCSICCCGRSRWPRADQIHAYFGLHVLARGVIFVDLSLAQVAALGLTVAILAGHAVTAKRATGTRWRLPSAARCCSHLRGRGGCRRKR